MKISDLKRVVNVDTINKYADILKNENNKDEKQIEAILKELSTKTPSREILLKTRLGFILRDLAARESLSKQVRDRARDLRTKWKEFHKSLLLAPKFDVKCDKPTTESRQNAKKTLANQFARSNAAHSDSLLFSIDGEENMSLIGDLEFTIFKYCNTLINAKYFSTVRKCLKSIADNPELSHRFLTYEISAQEFLTKSVKYESSSSLLKDSQPELANKGDACGTSKSLSADSCFTLD